MEVGVRSGEVHLRWDLRKIANALALEIGLASKTEKEVHVAYPISAAFTTAFSTPPAAETCAPTFHREVFRSGRELLSTSFVTPALRLSFVEGSVFSPNHAEVSSSN